MKHNLPIAAVCAAWVMFAVGCGVGFDDSDAERNPSVGLNTTSGGSYITSDPEPEAVTQIPVDIRDYFDRSVEERRRIRRELKSEIAELNRARRTAGTAERRLAIDTEIDRRNQKLADLATSYPVPPINIARLHEGLIGGIGRVLVVDVQEGSTALVCRAADRQHVVMLKLLGFVNMAPDEERIFETAFQVTETTEISTPRGGEQTVFVLKVFRDVKLDPYKPLYEREHPVLAEDETSATETPSTRTEIPTSTKPPATEPTTTKPVATNPEPSQNRKPSNEKAAASKLKLAKVFVKKGNTSVAKKRLRSIIDDYPETDAAQQAKSLLNSLD